MAQSRHRHRAERCPLLGVKRTLGNRRSSISIYEYRPSQPPPEFSIAAAVSVSAEFAVMTTA
jgi:hypothetical protein